MLSIAAAGFDETVEVSFRFEDLAFPAELLLVLTNNRVRLLVPELESRQNLAEVVLGLGKDLLNRLVRWNREDGHIHGLGAARAENGDGRDDAQTTFGADEELLEVETFMLAHLLHLYTYQCCLSSAC